MHAMKETPSIWTNFTGYITFIHTEKIWHESSLFVTHGNVSLLTNYETNCSKQMDASVLYY